MWAKYEIIWGLETSGRRDLEEKEGREILEIIRIVKWVAKFVPKMDEEVGEMTHDLKLRKK